MQYIIVESISAFNYAKKKFKKADICWASSSPKVNNFLYINKVNFLEIEKLVNEKELHEIEKISKYICNLIIKESNKIFEKKKYIDLRCIAGLAIFKKIYSIFYKTYLLNKILDLTKKKIICVGNPKISSNTFFTEMGTFDNFFAIIGNHYKKKITILKYHENVKVYTKSENIVFTKIISFLSSNFSNIIYKLFNHVKSVNFFKKILDKKEQKQILIINPTDFISLSFYNLIRWFSIVLFNENFSKLNNKIEREKNSKLKIKFEKKYNFINRHYTKILNNSLLKKKQIINYDIPLSLVTFQVMQYLQSIEKNSIFMENSFKKIISKFKKDFCIISNNSMKKAERLFTLYCQSTGIKMISFEHGLRGNSQIDKLIKNYYQQYQGDYGVYYWKNSIKNSYDLKHQKKIIDGFPLENNNIFNFYIKRFIVKIYLGISIFKKTIVFLSELERNNDQLPKISNDYTIVQNNRKIINYLAKKYPKKIVVLKLYASQKFIESYLYEDLEKKYKNIKVIKDINFDYMTDIFDDIYISTSSSTIVKCMNSRAKVYFLNLYNKNYFIKPFIERKIKINNKFVKSCYLLNKRLKKSKYKWINTLK